MLSWTIAAAAATTYYLLEQNNNLIISLLWKFAATLFNDYYDKQKWG